MYLSSYLYSSIEREKGERVWAVPAYQHQCQGDEANCVGDAVWGSVYSLGKHYKAQHPHSHGKLNTAICLIWAVVDDDKDDNQQLTFCKQSEQPTLSQLEHILDSQQAAFESSDTISIGEEAPACANALDSGSISDESEIEIETGLDVDYQRSMQDRVQFLTRANLSTKRTLQQRRQLVAQADEDIVTLKARCEQMRRIRAEHLQEICYLENTLQMGTKDLADATERLLQVKSM